MGRALRHNILPLEDRTFIAIQRTADALGQEVERILKSHGLTAAQYNVLRILRGADLDGLPCNTIAARMISRDPDMTRLLDRMEKRNFITRQRQTEDRRVVKTCITTPGLEILKRLDTPIRELHKNQFRHIPVRRLKILSDLLSEVSTLC
jgi:DNA-binding MarR family transcriptional regulator